MSNFLKLLIISKIYLSGEKYFKKLTAMTKSKKTSETNNNLHKPGIDQQYIRLNKYIASTGLCSRRAADEYIVNGQITVNDEVITELGAKIKPGDTVKYRGKKLTEQKKIYIILNKPKDCVTTVKDPHAKRTVFDLIGNQFKERIYPVGRLDRNTMGILLFTNDGDLAKKLTHPSYNKLKVYQVHLNRPLKNEDLNKIADGLTLEDGFIKVDSIDYVDNADKKQAGVEIHSGRNRIVRRIFEHLGYKITMLDRVYFAGLTKKGLPRGKWRYLSREEVSVLKRGSYK
jgi:23S rRNA pseudouridine2605 synthase